MGLDMMLYMEVSIKNDKLIDKLDEDVKTIIDITSSSDINIEVGYWRKANAIHKWFVDTVQDGKDDCEKYDVDFDELLVLRECCIEEIKHKDNEDYEGTLTPTSGFFFGDTCKDEYYYNQLQYTIDLINKLEKFEDKYYFSYMSSW